VAGNSNRRKRRGRRVYGDELKGETVQMLLDAHRAELVAEILGVSSRWVSRPSWG
jgi:hypothetical protein